MSFVEEEVGRLGSRIEGSITAPIREGLVDPILGVTGAEAATEAAAIQAAAGTEAAGLLDPFSALGATGIEQAGFLTDPQAQFDFLQQNPLFSLALEQANTETQQLAAARGRLSAGDTLQQLSQNVLLAASPLISEQKSSIGGLIDLGAQTATGRGNLLTGVGAAEAGGVVGAAGARAGGVENLIHLATLAGGAI